MKVCEEAKCPNIGECWGGGEDHTATATIMVGFGLKLLLEKSLASFLLFRLLKGKHGIWE